MRAHRPIVPRRLLPPTAAMAAIAATAGYLLGAPLVQAVAGPPDAGPATPSARTAAPVAGPSARPAPSTTDVPRVTRTPGAITGAPTARGARTTTTGVTSVRYRFLLLQPDRTAPIRWDPCRPLHYRIALGTVPRSEVGAVEAAFDAVGAALGGMRFVDDGVTSVIPATVDDSARAGVDVVFAFALPGHGPGRSPLLSGWEAGRGGFAAVGRQDGVGSAVERPTHGSVVVDAGIWRTMTSHDRAVLYLHEIGHVVGLDHPRDGRQIMSSGAYDLPARYQAGDLQGLARLGRQAGCAG